MPKKAINNSDIVASQRQANKNALAINKAIAVIAKDMPVVKDISSKIDSAWQTLMKFDKRGSQLFDKAFSASDKVQRFLKRSGLAKGPGKKVTNTYKFVKRLRNQVKRTKNGFIRNADNFMKQWR